MYFISFDFQDRNDRIYEASLLLENDNITAAEFLRRVTFEPLRKLNNFDYAGANDEEIVHFGDDSDGDELNSVIMADVNVSRRYEWGINITISRWFGQ